MGGRDNGSAASRWLGQTVGTVSASAQSSGAWFVSLQCLHGTRGGGGGGTLAWHVSSVQRRVEHIPRLGCPLVVAVKHRVVGQLALSPMLVGFPDDKPHVGQYVPDPFRVGLGNYGHVRSERGHPRDQGAHLPLDRGGPGAVGAPPVAQRGPCCPRAALVFR